MAQTPCCVQHVCLQLPAVNLGSEEVLAAGSGPAFAFNAAPGTGGAAQATPCKSKVGVHAGAFCIHRIHCGEKEGDKRRAAGGGRWRCILTAAAAAWGRDRNWGVGGCAVGPGRTSGHHRTPKHHGTPTNTPKCCYGRPRGYGGVGGCAVGPEQTSGHHWAPKHRGTPTNTPERCCGTPREGWGQGRGGAGPHYGCPPCML